MSDEFTIEMSEWIFPDIDVETDQENNDINSLFIPDVNESSLDYPNNETSANDSIDEPIYSEQKRSLHDERNQIKKNTSHSETVENHDDNRFQEVEKLKTEYQSRVDILNQLINKLKTPLSIIDQDIIELMQDIVKKMTKRIICKEITMDPNVFPQIISELKTLINTKNDMINIYLSADDYHLLMNDQNESIGLTQIDASLSQGDVIIKSNFAEIRALLNERMDQLMRIQHD